VTESPRTPEPGRERPDAQCDFRDFFLEWYPKLVRYLASTFDGSADADDVTVEAMLAARAKWDSLDDPLRAYDKPHSWVFKVAQRMMIRELTKKKRFIHVEIDEVDQGAEPIDAHICRLDVESAIRRLPRREAQAVTLYYLLGFDVAGVSSIMGIAEGAVKRYLADGRGRLTVLLRLCDEGGEGGLL
jgi:RNA polymerase sigma-70 factor (ECF subfamily)